METNFNIGSLKIVRTPLMDYFRLIQVNLNENIQLINDKKIPVNFESIDILKKVSGTLKMIGLFGVNKVLSLVNESLEAVKSAKFDSNKSLSVLQASSKILSSVGFYLDKILAGEQDQPTKFFDEYSALSRLIGKESNIKELFTPKLEFKEGQSSELQNDLRVGVFVNSTNKEKLIQTLKSSHETIQSSVAALFDLINKKAYSSADDKSKYQNVIKNIYSALDTNQKLKLSKNVYLIIALQKLFVSIISPVFNDNFEDLIVTDLNSVKINLAKIERSSKFILDGVTSLDDTEKTASVKVDDDVSREILFFIIAILAKEKNTALKNMPIYQEVSSVFNIDFYANQLKETNIEVSIAQKNPEVSNQIEKIFVEVKEELSLLTSKNASNEDFAFQHSIKFINNINKFSELMSGVSSAKLKQLISLISSALTSVKNKEIQFSESLQKEISVALVLVEYGINNFVKSIISDIQKIDFEKQTSIQIERINLSIKNKTEELAKFTMPVLDSSSQKSDERKAFLLIFDKLHKDLRKSEEILNDIFRDTSNTEDLEIVIKTLNSAKGIFSIINKDDLSKVVSSIINIWKQVAASGFESVNSKERSESVALLSGILLFIEASKNDNEIEANAMYAQIMSRVNPVKVEDASSKVEISNIVGHVEFNHEEVQIEEVVQIEQLVKNVQEIKLEDIAVQEVAPEEVTVISHVQPIVKTQVEEDFVDHSDDADLTEVYLMEAEEVLENIAQSMKSLAKNSQDTAEVTNIRRYFHTLKGSGRMVGLLFLGEVAWMVEQTLNKVMNSDTELSTEMLNDLNATKMQFDSWINELKNTNKVSVDLVTFKKMWIKHNSHITNQIEINIDSNISKDESLEIVSKQEEINLDNEITFDDMTGLDKTVTEKTLDDENNTLSFEDFSLEVDDNVTDDSSSLKIEVEKQSEVFDIPSDSTIDILDELNEISTEKIEESVEDKKDTVNINGVEVSQALYQLFKEESDNHLQELRLSTHNHVDFRDGFEITQDFMRHAHTLASIAKSVNMNVFSNIVAKIEFIANICIDKKIKLSESDFFVLKNAIDKLDIFAIVLDNSLEDNQHYEIINNKLDSLLNSLTNLPEESSHTEILEVESTNDLEINQSEEMEENMEEEFVDSVIPRNEKSNGSQVNIEDIVSAISNNIAGLFKSNLESLKESLESVKTEINNVKSDISNQSHTQQEIDIDGLINSINEKVMSAVDEQYDKLTSVLREKDFASNEKSEMLTKNIASLANELEVLNKNQQNIEKLQKENHEAIKKDLRYLNYAIKKKHSVSYREVAEENDGEIKEVQPLIAQAVEAITFEDTQNNELVTVSNSPLTEKANDSIDVNLSEDETILSLDEEKNNESELVEVHDENISSIEEFDTSSYMSKEDFTEAQEDLNFNMHEVVENLNPNTNEDFEGVDELPSDLEEKEKIKNINANLTVVKSSNSIADFLNNNEFVKTIFEEKISTVEDEVDEEIVEISKDETKEILESVDNIMESINDDVLNMEQNDELKRLLHTLKGSVRMAGINKVGAIAHRLESLLDYSESRGISLFKMKDLLEDELSKVNYLLNNVGTVLTKEKAQWLDGSIEVSEEIIPIASFDLQVNSSVVDFIDTPKVSQPVIKREEKQFIKIGANLIDALINEAGEVRLTRTTLEGMLTNNRRSLNELRVSSASLLKHLKEIEVQAEIQIAATREKLSESKDFDPLEFDRFTRLQEVTRFMNESVADVQDTVSSMENVFKNQDGAVVQQAILTNNLLDTLMKVRLLPVDNISDRLYKITRSTSKDLNKKVTLELFGEKTEMDRLVLDKIISPLEHLLRNCIAHGVEEPAERLKKGKSVVGKVTIKTSVDGNFIVMNIKDDGAGINVEKVRSLGLKKGLLKYDIEYTEQQIVELIFSSGFSTSDTISQVSGRGVGMDVVKKEISELGGSIDIKTMKDKGTEFNIVLPVAVATNQAMLTEIAGKLVAIPALIVDEVSSLKKDKMQSAYLSGQVEVKGVNYPLYYLGHMLGLIPSSQLPELKVYNTLIAVTYLGETVVVHVDELQTTSEILIKTMGVHFNKISGVLGATLLGDGRQGLVINPVMLKTHYEKNLKNLNIFNEGETITTDKMTGVITVMVVDDSVTVRRATTKVLERYGYNIVLAKDGEDGLEQLQIVIPDIILSDIEMPRMDGFEFAKNVKNTEKYAHIPIVMITSRTADKHKNYAYSLGVNGFLGKPYKEEELIETIKKLVGKLNN